MSPQLEPFPPPARMRSALAKNLPDAVPPTEELEMLHRELTELRQRSLDRARKAAEDMRAIDESMRRLKEKEKGKARALEKVKRERGFTPQTHDSETPRASQFSHPAPPAPRLPSVPLSATSSRTFAEPRKSAGDSKKKKKRKREDDSDDDLDPHRSTKPTPPPVPTNAHIPKAAKPTGSFANLPTKLPSGPDFSLPPPSPLLPPRPPIPQPPIAGPSKPTEVTEDFSKAKQPSQVQVSTFYTSIEPYIRNIKEEDIGFLEYTADEVEPYVLPRLGKHYAEQWEEEDIALHGAPLPSTSAIARSRPRTAPLHPNWDPATLNEADLLVEEKGHGSVTERLVSALLPVEESVVWKGVKAAEEAMEGRHGVGAGSAAGRQVIVEDLEKRIRDSLKFHRLLDTTPDFADAVDDPIATALRHAQRELRTVVATNKARKARLVDIARDRLGYQEYLDMRDSIDRNISGLYSKLQKKDTAKASKKKKKGASTAAVGDVPATTPVGTWPAAAGLGPDDSNELRVPDQLKALVENRRKWVDVVGGVFEEKQKENPGRIWGSPSKSIYEGLEEDVKAMLEGREDRMANGSSGAGMSITVNGKGKGRAVDEMDIG
ncbi:hypothetical protein DENSPDRAFT_844851 [Dentipellis sp. KUC8613]|nr:hypothetical protein DENSPDRAFT_844851 [Dentipellis sp. KUC8613]